MSDDRAAWEKRARGDRSSRAAVIALVCSFAAVALTAYAARPNPPLVEDDFSGPDGLITNEHAEGDHADPRIARSPTWHVTSGSLFRRGDRGWTGRPDGGSPDVCSCVANGSAVFRMVSRRTDVRDATVSFTLRNVRLTETPRTPPVTWDGVHVMLRWQSPQSTYYVSVNRRDEKAVIKKKMPGGPANGGTYVDVGPARPWPVPYGRDQHVRATIRTRDDGAVAIRLTLDDEPIIDAVDRGVGGAPIRSPGAVGIRGDNADFSIDALRVTDPD